MMSLILLFGMMADPVVVTVKMSLSMNKKSVVYVDINLIGGKNKKGGE